MVFLGSSACDCNYQLQSIFMVVERKERETCKGWECDEGQKELDLIFLWLAYSLFLLRGDEVVTITPFPLSENNQLLRRF